MEEEHEQRMEGGEDVDFREEGDDEDEDEGVEIVTNRSLLNIRQTSGNGTIWSMGGARKNEAVRELIKCFGSMVESEPKEYAIPDHRGRYRQEDLVYRKLLNASKYVIRAKRTLLKNESFDTREFTMYIASKKWVKNIVRPLLELCSKEDTILAMRCCGLMLVLLKRISDYAAKLLQEGLTKVKKATKPRSLAPMGKQEPGKEGDKENDKEGDKEGVEADKNSGANASSNKSIALRDDEDSDGEGRRRIDEIDLAAEIARVKKNQEEIENAKLQVSSLMSFKEGLCSERCSYAITNAFQIYWSREQLIQPQTNEDDKQSVAICFSYLRRMLAIDAHRNYSSAGEVHNNRLAHFQLIVQMRQILSVMPGVCSDFLNPYHADWLTDIILIIYFSMQDIDAKDLFHVWQSGALLDDFDSLLEEDNATEEAVPETKSNQPEKKKPEKKKALLPIHVPAVLKTSSISNTKGSLSLMLRKEKNDRETKLPSSRPGRFNGMYRAEASTCPLPPSSSSSSSFGPKADLVLRDAFSSEQNLPQVKSKRTKKNLTFLTLEASKQKDTTSSAATVANSNSNSDSSSMGAGADKQKATVVVATMANLISHEIALKPLVKRVNEDLRRDEMRIGPDLELRYFEILTKLLQYNRLKLMDQKRRFIASLSSQSADATIPAWEPNLKNVMDALDRMSFTRVTSTIDRLSKNPSKLGDLIIPVCLLKEMVCYLRTLLESSLEGHHEIAIAAMFRMYFAGHDQRLDPVSKLLSAWKPGTFSRKYLQVLVELVHETMKTLDAARSRYAAYGESDAFKAKMAKKGKSKKDKDKSLELEQYAIAVMRFNVDEYFSRLVTNHTVRLYTRMLENYSTNDAVINRYIYTFLWRMQKITLEQQYRLPHAPSIPSPQSSQLNIAGAGGPQTHNQLSSSDDFALGLKESIEGAGTGEIGVVHRDAQFEEITLGYMLFNVQTILVFSTILNDNALNRERKIMKAMGMELMVSLIKNIVRRMGRAAEKNTFLLGEAVVLHPRAQDHCCQLDSLYEAPAYVVAAEEAVYQKRKGKKGVDMSDSEQSVISSESEEDDLGDEFGEEDEKALAEGAAQIMAKKKAVKETARLAKKKEKDKNREKEGKKKRKDVHGKRSIATDMEPDGEPTDTPSTAAPTSTNKSSKVRRQGGAKKRVGKRGLEDRGTYEEVLDSNSGSSDSNESLLDGLRVNTNIARVSNRISRSKWSVEEDRLLMDQYSIYKGSRSVFTSIALNEQLIALTPSDTTRTEKQIERRIRDLEQMAAEAAEKSDKEMSDSDKDDPATAIDASQVDEVDATQATYAQIDEGDETLTQTQEQTQTETQTEMQMQTEIETETVKQLLMLSEVNVSVSRDTSLAATEVESPETSFEGASSAEKPKPSQRKKERLVKRSRRDPVVDGTDSDANSLELDDSPSKATAKDGADRGDRAIDSTADGGYGVAKTHSVSKQVKMQMNKKKRMMVDSEDDE